MRFDLWSVVLTACGAEDDEAVETIDRRIVVAECDAPVCRVHELTGAELLAADRCLETAEPGAGVGPDPPPWFVVVFEEGKRSPYRMDRTGQLQTPGRHLSAPCLVPLLTPLFSSLADGSLAPDPRDAADLPLQGSSP